MARCANGSHQKSGTHENRVLRVNGTHLFVSHLHLARICLVENARSNANLALNKTLRSRVFLTKICQVLEKIDNKKDKVLEQKRR